jgi:hypothetical protein
MAASFTDDLPRFSPDEVGADYDKAPVAAPAQSWAPVAGAKAGFAGLGAGVGALTEAAGKLSGVKSVEQAGSDLERYANDSSWAQGRPDLEQQDWFGDKSGGVGGFLTKGAYELSKAAPLLAGGIAAQFIPGADAAVDATGLSRLAAMMPKFIGGAGLGSEAAGTEAGLLAGRGLAKSTAALTALNYPQAVGGQYESAKEQPGGATTSDAARSILLGAPLAAAESVVPGGLTAHGLFGGLEGSAEKSIGSRVLHGGVTNAAAGAIAGGLQEAANIVPRDDIAPMDKLHHVVDSVVQGGAMGGVMGAVFGVRRQSAADLARDLDGQKGQIDAVIGKPNTDGQFEIPGIKPETPPQAEAAPAAGVRPVAPGQPESTLFTPGEMGERVQPVAQMHEQLRKFAGVKEGVKNDFIDSMDAATHPEAYNIVQDELDRIRDTKEKNPTAVKLGKEFGILDAKGLVRDLPTEREAAVNEQDRLTALAKNNPGIMPKVLAQVEKIKDIDGDILAQKDAAALRNAPAAAEAPPVAQAPRGLDATLRAMTPEEESRGAPAPAAEPNPSGAQGAGFLQPQATVVPPRPGESGQQGFGLLRPQPPEVPKPVVEAPAPASEPVTTPLPPAAPVEPPAPVPAPDAHAVAREILGTAEGKKLPPGLSQFADKPEADLREHVLERMEEKNPPKYIKKLSDGFNARDEGPEETPNAVREPGPEGVLSQVPAEAGERVGVGDTQGHAPAQEAAPVKNSEPHVEADPKAGDVTAVPLPDTAESRAADIDAVTSGTRRPLDRLTPEDTGAVRPTRTPEEQAAMQAMADSALANQAKNIARGGSGAKPNNEVLTAPAPARPQTEAGKGFAAFRKKAGETPVFDQSPTGARFYNAPIGSQSFANAMKPEKFDTEFAKLSEGVPQNVLDHIHVLDKSSQLPSIILRELAEQGHDSRLTQGVMKDGEVYLIRRTFNDEKRLQEVFDHEIFHKQAREVFGASHTDVFSSIFARAGDLPGVMKLAAKYGKADFLEGYIPAGPLNVEAKARLADELMAMLAEHRAGPLKGPLMEWAGKMKQAVISTLRELGMHRLADRLNTFSSIDAAAFISDVRKAHENGDTYIPSVADNLRGNLRTGSTGRELVAQARGNALEARASQMRQIPQQDETVGKMQRFVTSFLDKLPGDHTNLSVAASKALLMLSNMDSIERWFPSIRVSDLQQMTKQIEKRMNQPGVTVSQITRAFQKDDPRGGKILQSLVDGTIHTGNDYSRAWADNTWQHGKSNAKELAADWKRGNDDFNKLGQGAGSVGQKLFRAHAALGDMQNYSSMSAFLEQAVKSPIYKDENIPGFDRNGPKDYLSRNDLFKNPRGSADFFKEVFGGQLAGAKQYLQEQRAEMGRLGKDSPAAARIAEKITPLANIVETYNANLKSMTQEPYFHAGRSGDYLVSMHAATDASGKRPDPKVIEAMQNRMAANGFGSVSMNQVSDIGHILMKFENAGQMNRMEQLAKEFKAKGWLNPNEDVTSGQVSQTDYVRNLGPKFLQQLLAAAEAKGMPADQVRELQTLAMDVLPNNDVRKVMQKRVGVQGFDSDMVANLEHRHNVNSNAVARLTTSGDMAQAVGNMNQAVRDSKTAMSGVESTKLQNAVQEVIDRIHGDPGRRVTQGFMDNARSLTHSWFIAMNPAYFTLQLSQVALNLAPELSKKFGVVRSYQAIGSVTNAAFKVLAAVTRGEGRAGFELTPELLKGAGLTKGQVNALMVAENSGDISSGFAGVFGRPQQQTTANKYLRMSNVSAMYAETIPRIVAILAAEKLGGDSAYIHSVMKDTMFNWNTANTARVLSKQGPLGRFSPIAGQFQNYTIHLTGKLLHETHLALGGNAESQKFMMAHLGAAIVLSGTLGLPAAGWLAGAAMNLSAMYNQGEGYDVEAHYLHFLRSMLGEGAAEVVSRGLPRYLGVDTSRYGDADLLPFTKLIEDRRRSEDAIKDYAFKAWGAPTSMDYNVAAGLHEIANGNVINGMKEMLPTGLRNLYGAYVIGQGRDGHPAYIDRQGREMTNLPAGASDIIKTALGFKSGAAAEAAEKSAISAGAHTGRMLHSGNIRKAFISAINNRDPAALQAALNDVQAYNDHPDHAGMPMTADLARAYTHQRLQEAIAKATGAPLSTSTKDAATRALIQ